MNINVEVEYINEPGYPARVSYVATYGNLRRTGRSVMEAITNLEEMIEIEARKNAN